MSLRSCRTRLQKWTNSTSSAKPSSRVAANSPSAERGAWASEAAASSLRFIDVLNVTTMELTTLDAAMEAAFHQVPSDSTETREALRQGCRGIAETVGPNPQPDSGGMSDEAEMERRDYHALEEETGDRFFIARGSRGKWERSALSVDPPPSPSPKGRGGSRIRRGGPDRTDLRMRRPPRSKWTNPSINA